MKKSELEIESESVKNSLKRIHIGGLTPNITKKELKEKFSSFGKVQDVEIKIKKDMDGEVFNTFAYIDIDAEDSSIQKCFSIFNKAKWKGRTLQLQVAKQHFLTRLEKERNTPEVTKVKKVKTSFHDPLANLTDVEDFNVKGKVPGTAIPGEKKWIVGKYGRVLPIVNVRDKTTNRLVHVDPSKFCHNLKKIKTDEKDENEDIDLEKLTWQMDEKNESSKRRRGDFSEFEDFQSKKVKVQENDWSEEMEEKMEEMRRRYDRSQKESQKTDETEIEVVKGEKVISVYHIPKDDFIYDSEDELPKNNDRDDAVGAESDSCDSVGSADTDEIIAMMNTCKSKKVENNTVNKTVLKNRDKNLTNSDSNISKVNNMGDDIDSDTTGKHKSKITLNSSSQLDSSVSNTKPKSNAKSSGPNVSFVDYTMKMTRFKGISMLDSSDDDDSSNSSTKDLKKDVNSIKKTSVDVSNDSDSSSGNNNSSAKSAPKINKISKDKKTHASVPNMDTSTSYSESGSDFSDSSQKKEQLRIKSANSKRKSRDSDQSDDSNSESNDNVEFSDLKKKVQDKKKKSKNNGSSSSKTDDPPSKKNIVEIDRDIQGVNLFQENILSKKSIKGSGKSAKKEIIESSDYMIESNMTNSACPVVTNQSDSEYDSDDFEKVAKKFSEKVGSSKVPSQSADQIALNNDNKPEMDSTASSISDNDTTASSISDNETTASSISDNETTASSISDNETTASSIGDNDTTASSISDNETTISKSPINDLTDNIDSDSGSEEETNFRPSESDGDQKPAIKTGESFLSEKQRKRKLKKMKKDKGEENIMKDIVKDNFFVSSSLLNTFAKKEPSVGGFSFLQTFGKKDTAESKVNEDDTPSYKLPWQLKPHDSEDEEIVIDDQRKKSSKSETEISSFFFQPKDDRLKEGIEFFHRKMDADVVEEIWQEERPRILANCRQRNRLALRRINQDKLRQRKKPFNSSVRGKKNDKIHKHQ